jgi:hypothetical protein
MFSLQKYRNGVQLWVVNVFSYTIHAQTHFAVALPPCPFHIFPSFCDVSQARSYFASSVHAPMAAASHRDHETGKVVEHVMLLNIWCVKSLRQMVSCLYQQSRELKYTQVVALCIELIFALSSRMLVFISCCRSVPFATLARYLSLRASTCVTCYDQSTTNIYLREINRLNPLKLNGNYMYQPP